ncbi:hypothetical protein BDW42DRAFT_160848 [Aspergillus taichungensis]|uniref:Uncharacterized protein n=1 Tax=Aspergillus taichungensis TaxID=482145 RepID=A0A2J5I5U1_9EURO|nr:hypothetical protein BDW42DRAFT_160848 [Aspergillus taichungensis]
MSYGSVTNWPRLYRRVYDHLYCGACFEQLEIAFEPRHSDPQLEHGLNPLRFWYESLKIATEKSKRSIANSPEQTLRWLRDAGFSDVSYETVTLLLNPQKQPVCIREAARWYQMAFVETLSVSQLG